MSSHDYSWAFKFTIYNNLSTILGSFIQSKFSCLKMYRFSAENFAVVFGIFGMADHICCIREQNCLIILLYLHDMMRISSYWLMIGPQFNVFQLKQLNKWNTNLAVSFNLILVSILKDKYFRIASNILWIKMWFSFKCTNAPPHFMSNGLSRTRNEHIFRPTHPNGSTQVLVGTDFCLSY